jgi:hypothetical protein
MKMSKRRAMRLSEFVELVAREVNLGIQLANKDGFVMAFVPEGVEVAINLAEDENGQVVIYWPDKDLYLENPGLTAPMNRCKFIIPLRFSPR